DFCANVNTFSGDFCVIINTFSGDFCAKLDFLLIIPKNCAFYLGISWGKKCFVFVGGFFGDFITLWVVFFLRNLIFYDEYETCGFDFCADGGGAAVGGSKWWFHFGEV
ncbi:MAG: hypothetical protein SPG67_00395, partial [Sodaliphilus sp.]|nr:hypothetical protein [Sodaliphilus sp.]